MNIYYFLYLCPKVGTIMTCRATLQRPCSWTMEQMGATSSGTVMKALDASPCLSGQSRVEDSLSLCSLLSYWILWRLMPLYSMKFYQWSFHISTHYNMFLLPPAVIPFSNMLYIFVKPSAELKWEEGKFLSYLMNRAKDSVKHFHVTRNDNSYVFGFNVFQSLEDFVTHFANQPLLGSDTGQSPESARNVYSYAFQKCT